MLALLCCILGGVFKFGASKIELSYAWQFLLSAPFNFGLALFTYVGGTRGGASKWLSRLVTGIGVLWGLGSGMLEQALVPLVIYFLARWHSTRKFPLHLFCAAVMLFLPLNASKYTLRADVLSAAGELSRLQQCGIGWPGEGC